MSAALFSAHPGKQTEFIRSTADRLFFGGARGGAHTLDSLVLTPFGFKPMRDIHIGSQVNNPDGSIAKVINEIPRGKMKIYEFTFIDGAKTRVTGDHLWLAKKTCTKAKAERNYINFEEENERVHGKIYTTDQLREEIKKEYTNLLIPLTEPVNFTKSYKENPRTVEPYLLGILIGDGCLTKTETNKVHYSSADEEIAEKIREYGYTVCRDKDPIAWKIENNTELRQRLEKLNLLGKYALTKFIPECYKYSSINDRLQLMQGLMDSDGSVDQRGHLSYTTISEKLATDVQWIVRSLGGKATISKYKAGYKNDDGDWIQCNDAFTVYINSKINDRLVYLPRKKNLIKENFNGGCSVLQRRIISIDYAGDEEAKCITVDHPNGLYTCDDFIVTHNSKTAGGCYKAAYQARTYHYEDAEGETIEKKKYLGQIKMRLNPRIVVDTVSIDYPEYQGLIIRRTFPDLEINVRPECDKLYLHDAHGNPFAYWLDKKKCYVFPSRAKIYLVHCRDRNALSKYIGGNNHFVFIDEANQFPWEWVEDIGSSVRSSNPELKAQMVLTSNPGGIGHYWLKSRFVDKCPPIPLGDKIYYKDFNVSIQPYKTAPSYIDEDGVEWQFIPATVFDNPSLLRNPNYVNVLKNITNPVKRAMWLEGRWDAAPGLFFDNFIYDDAHVLQQKDFVFDVDFSTTTHNFYRFIDYGTKNATAVLFAAVNKKTAKMVLFDELIMRQGNLVKDEFDFDFDVSSAPSVQARMILAYTKNRHPYLHEADFEENIADSAMWMKTSEKNNELYSPAELFEEAGLELTSCGRKDRVIEAAIVYNSFVPLEDGIPKTQITENCLYLIETIQSADQNPKNIDDIDTQGEDHAIDALKYGSKYIFGTITEQKKKEPGWRNEMKKENSSDSYSWRAA